MRNSAFGWVVLVGCLVACSSGGDASSDADSSGTDAPTSRGSESRQASDEGAREPVDISYRFVETSDGMTVEAISADEVQTSSCAVRSCTGLCNECAASACRASGGLAATCRDLVAQCNDSCKCADGSSCGLPVCGTNLGGINICMIGSEPADATRTPVPNSTPIESATLPSNAAQPAM